MDTPLRVWNGIFPAGDGRAKRDLKTISLRRDWKSETTMHEKSPQTRPFCLKAIYCAEDWLVAGENNREFPRNRSPKEIFPANGRYTASEGPESPVLQRFLERIPREISGIIAAITGNQIGNIRDFEVRITRPLPCGLDNVCLPLARI
jgi:hypothetical protein